MRENKLKTCQMCEMYTEKRCLGCFHVWYCGTQCQKQDWSTHKNACKKRKAEFMEVDIDERSSRSVTMTNDKKNVYINQMNAIKRTPFIIKVQFPLSPLATSADPFMCYNEKRDVEYMMKGNTELASLLKKAIQEQESRIIGKGYFTSFVKEGKHFIHPAVLSPEKW